MWLHVPSTLSKSVQAAECAESAQVLPCNTSDAPPVVYATSNGTDTPRQLSWVGWKTRPWIKLLSGTVLNRSIANHGADSWISQLRQSRAKETASPESDCLRTTNETSGPLPEQPCATWNANTSSWKTSQACLFLTEKGEEQPLSYGLSESWPRTGGTRNGTMFLRKRSERTTVENGYFCWPTVNAQDGHRGKTPFGYEGHMGGENLNTAAQSFPPELWTTAMAHDITPRGTGQVPCAKAGNACLATDAIHFPQEPDRWSTPNVPNGGRAMPPEAVTTGRTTTLNGKKVQMELQHQATIFPPDLWPTADCNTATYSNGKRGENIRESSTKWPTARAEDAENCGNHPNAMDSLTGATKAFPMEPWATAMASDDGHKVTPASHQENLIGQSVHFPSSPQQETTTSAGYGYSTLIQLLCQLFGVQSEEEFRAIPKQLNPRFVEFLMGWPKGWASTLAMETLGPTNSDYAETA